MCIYACIIRKNQGSSSSRELSALWFLVEDRLVVTLPMKDGVPYVFQISPLPDFLNGDETGRRYFFFLVTSIFFMFCLKGWLIYDFWMKFMFCEIHGAKAEILMELEDSKLRIGANFIHSSHFLLNMTPSQLFTQLLMSALACFIHMYFEKLHDVQRREQYKELSTLKSNCSSRTSFADRRECVVWYGLVKKNIDKMTTKRLATCYHVHYL